MRGSAEPILDISSDRGSFSVSEFRLSAEKKTCRPLAAVITARELGRVLLDRLPKIGSLDVIAPARLLGFVDAGDRVSVEIERDRLVEVHSKAGCWWRQTAVARPSANNSICRCSAGSTDNPAVVTNISPAQAHRNVAYERFTDSGRLHCCQ